ncbi:MAG: ribosome-associated translation inhibitor RaiA [Hyphomicrobium sp.]
MTIQITGKNVDAGDAYKAYVSEKIDSVLGKYLGTEINSHVRLEKEKTQFHTACSIRLKSGLMLEAQGGGASAYASADSAIEHLEKRLRRHKRRIKNHHNGRTHAPVRESEARDYTVKVGEDEDTESIAANENGTPIVIAETARSIREMPVSEAVMHLDLSDGAFLLFRNAGHGGLNVVYRRSDGHVGWIDPQADATAGKV